jgi:hypothetical protein
MSLLFNLSVRDTEQFLDLILFKWIKLKEIILLDTSYCNELERHTMFLPKLRKSNKGSIDESHHRSYSTIMVSPRCYACDFVIGDGSVSLPKVGARYHYRRSLNDDIALWVFRKQITVTSLTIFNIDLVMNKDGLDFCCQFKSISTLVIQYEKPSTFSKSVDLKKKRAIAKLLFTFRHLRKLEIRGVMLSLTMVRCVFTYLRNLTTVVISGEYLDETSLDFCSLASCMMIESNAKLVFFSLFVKNNFGFSYNYASGEMGIMNLTPICQQNVATQLHLISSWSLDNFFSFLKGLARIKLETVKTIVIRNVDSITCKLFRFIRDHCLSLESLSMDGCYMSTCVTHKDIKSFVEKGSPSLIALLFTFSSVSKYERSHGAQYWVDPDGWFALPNRDSTNRYVRYLKDDKNKLRLVLFMVHPHLREKQPSHMCWETLMPESCVFRIVDGVSL